MNTRLREKAEGVWGKKLFLSTIGEGKNLKIIMHCFYEDEMEYLEKGLYYKKNDYESSRFLTGQYYIAYSGNFEQDVIDLFEKLSLIKAEWI